MQGTRVDAPPRGFSSEILLASFAALLLEVSYTRLLSFKLYYYYTYLVIGFAMLGIGSGAILVALRPTLLSGRLERLVARCCLAGSVAIAASYLVIAWMPMDTGKLWTTWQEPLRMAGLCAAFYASFAPIGVLIAALFASRPERVPRLYFADLLGAGLACAVVVPLLAWVGPPGCIAAAAALLAAVAARLARSSDRALWIPAAAVSFVLALGFFFPDALPEPVPDRSIKTVDPGNTLYTRWHPVFRVDVTGYFNAEDAVREIHHDGLWGSTLHRYDGDPSTLGRFETDERSFPFRVLGRPPRHVLIIGAAGGHEILASLHFGAEKITAVELNPVTLSLLTEVYPDYTGRLAEDPRIELVNDDGRSFLARQPPDRYDLVYFVAPDSYTATNAASTSAYVLSESYLYTVEMIGKTLEHLAPDGIVCMQFGEFYYDIKPSRTARYATTAREAFRRRGVDDFARHVLVATTEKYIPLSTILLGREAFGPDRIERFLGAVENVEGSRARHVPGRRLDDGAVNRVISLPPPQLARFLHRNLWDVSPITDDGPFFWHFVRFQTVLAMLHRPYRVVEAEDSLGERVILVMLFVALGFAACVVLVPFLAIRSRWRALPSKLRTGVYFGSLGVGFMFFEIPLIQKLTLLLGFPTYSLTVTLAGLLVFSGLGSLASTRWAGRRDAALPLLLAGLALLVLFYVTALGPLVERLLAGPLALRVAFALAAVAPLGLALGAFLPLGLGTVARLAAQPGDYVAWAWAVNGFASVLGSVLATILSMSYGFNAVLGCAFGLYAIAVAALHGVGRGVAPGAARVETPPRIANR